MHISKIMCDCEISDEMCSDYIKTFKDIIIKHFESKAYKNSGQFWSFSISNLAIFIEDYQIIAKDPRIKNTRYPKMIINVTKIANEIIKFANDIAPIYKVNLLVIESTEKIKYYIFTRDAKN